MIFLMSSERSGSNMLRAIMARHSQVSAPTPAHLVRTVMPMLAGYGNLQNDANFRRLAGHVLDIIDSQLGSWNAPLDVDELVKHATDRSFASMLRYVYAAEAALQGKAMSFVKDNGNILWAPHLGSMFANARFIYLVRDPRDCVLSWMNSPSHAGGVSAACAAWQVEQSAALAAYAIAGDAMPILLVRYEDLVSSPRSELDRICEFIGIEQESAMTEDFSNQAHRDESRKIANWENMSGEIKRKNFGKFKDAMSPGRVRQIERRLAFEMQILGYRPTQAVIAREPLTALGGKALRAILGSIRLLLGGRRRREELGVRVRRLQSLRKIQAEVRRSPRELAGRADNEDGA